MCGFVLGLLAFFAIFKLVGCGRRRRCHGRGGGPWGGRGRRRGGFMHWIFEDLDASPRQEESIRDTLRSFRETARDSKQSWRESLEQLARALRSDELDHEAVGEAWVRQDKALDGLRLAAVEALGRIHETLDERQRARLADLIERRGEHLL